MMGRQIIFGVCCTRGVLHSGLTHDDGMERYRGMTWLCVLAMMVELWMRKKEMGDGDDNDMEDMRGYEESGVWLARLGLEDLVSVLWPTGSELVPAVSGMVNWLAHQIYYVPVSHDDFPHLIGSLSFLCSTLPSPKNTKLSHPSLSLHAIIMS